MMDIGHHAEVARRYSSDDLKRFSGLSDLPDATAVPEPLIAALFSYLLGVKLPGPGTNYLKQEMRFLLPAPVDETLTARVEITRLRPEKHLVDLWSTCRRQDGTIICEGRSLVLAKDVAG
jgi:acyl dehydratase